MGEAIGQILPMAVGVAISPIPIVAVILMLFSPKAKVLGPLFLVGWVLGMAIVGGIVLLVADPSGVEDDAGGPSTVSSVIKLVLGLGLLFLAYRGWHNQPKAGETPEPPKWMAAIDTFTPIKALGAGAFLSGPNPKNLALTVAAAVAIAQLSLPGSEAVAALAVYILIASISVTVPVIWYLVSRERATATLETWRTWLIAHNAVVMAVLLLVIGVKLLGDGISGLSA
jgi:hypothetical protein